MEIQFDGAATRGAYHNTQTGRSTIAGRGYNTNIYTGNTYGYRGSATYNPNTGIVVGGGAGYVGNIYTGQGAAGRGGSIYNTNTNAGVAIGKNNVFAGKDGTPFTATTGIAVIGRVTAATAGNLSIGRSPSGEPSSKCVIKARSALRTSTPCAVSVALGCVEEVAGANPGRAKQQIARSDGVSPGKDLGWRQFADRHFICLSRNSTLDEIEPGAIRPAVRRLQRAVERRT